jgi:hypothetical protein
VCFFLRCSDGYLLVNVLSVLYDALMDDNYALELPVLEYRDIVPDLPEDDELEIEVES